MTNLKKIITISILSLMCSPFYAMDKGKGKAFITWSPETKQETPVTAPSTTIEKDPTPGPKEVQPSLTETLPESLTSEEQFEADTTTAKKESLKNEPAIAGPSTAPVVESPEDSDLDAASYESLEAELEDTIAKFIQPKGHIDNRNAVAEAKKSNEQIVYTKHARKRMAERNVTEADVFRIIQTGGNMRSKRGATIYIEKNKTNPLAVIVNEDNTNKHLVITLYRQERPVTFSRKALTQMKELGLSEKEVIRIVKHGNKKGSNYIENTNRNPLMIKTRPKSGQLIIDEILTRKQADKKATQTRKDARDRKDRKMKKF